MNYEAEAKDLYQFYVYRSPSLNDNNIAADPDELIPALVDLMQRAYYEGHDLALEESALVFDQLGKDYEAATLRERKSKTEGVPTSFPVA